MVDRLVEKFRAIALVAGFAALTGCGGSDGSPPATPTPPPPPAVTRHLGGVVSGLGAGASASLSAGAGNTASLTANGAYTFPLALNQGTAFTVTLTQQPANQTCSLANAAGTVGVADVTNINLTCVDLPTVGGTLSGLGAGNSVTLLNAAEHLVLSADGAFTFASRLHTGDAYAVTVDVQPTAQSCAVTNGAGTMGQTRVTDVTVVCAPPTAGQVKVALYAGDLGGAGQSDGTGPSARFRFPVGLVGDPVTGTVWVADSQNRAIRQIDATGVVTTIAGKLGAGGSVDGQGAAARFLSPSGIARDAAGNLYVTDAQMHVVRMVTPAGLVSTVAGLAGVSGSADGLKSSARFKSPSGIASTADGTLYVADTANHTIRIITPGGVVSTIAGVAGTFGHDDTFGGQPTTFFGPSGVAVTSAGVVFVADSSNATIRAISPAGVVTTVAGQPQSVGYADGAASTARFDDPTSLVYSESDAALYITDSINGVVRRLVGATVTTVAGDPALREPIDGGGMTARMHLPIGIAMTSPSTLYISENNFHTVRKVLLDGSISTVAGQARAWQFTSANGVGDAARFLLPNAIAAVADQPGKLWVTDASDHTLREITPAMGPAVLGSVTTIVGQPGIAGSNYGTNPITPPLLRSPNGVSASGLVADTGNMVIAHLDPLNAATLLSGLPTTPGFVDGTAAAARYFAPSGLSDGPSVTYVADVSNHSIRQVLRSDGSVTTLAGNGHAGDADGATPQFNHPNAVLYVGDGVIVADTDNHTIRKVLFSGGTITLAGLAHNPGDEDGAAADARFKSPLALAADAAGNVYIADSGNFTIRKLTPAGQVTTIAGQVGVEGFTPGDTGVLSTVRGLAVGSDGALYATMYQGVVRLELP